MNLHRKKEVLIGILLLSFSYLSAQHADTITYKPNKFVKHLDVRYEGGAMLGDGSDIGEQLVNSSFYNGFDIRLGFRRNDENDIYSNVYRRPYIGLGWYASTFHNADIGKPNALYFFLTMPMKFELDKKLTFSYSAAFGLSYNFNPHDPTDNPANIFIGSFRNVYLHLGFLMNYRFSDRWAANATLGFKHFSNGAYKLPNHGINLIPLTLGVSYRLTEDDVIKEARPIPDYTRHDLFNVTFSAGSKNYTEGDEKNYVKTALGFNYLRQLNYKYRLGVGVDIFYSPHSDLRNTSDKSSFSKSVSYAIVGAWEWSITKRLYVPIGVAVYLHRNPDNGEVLPYYERVGMRYRFAKNYCAGVTIKAHAGRADFLEWTIGYTFHKDKNRY